MKKFNVIYAAAMSGMLTLGSSCSKDVLADVLESEVINNSTLSIMTRADGEDEGDSYITYPVRVYVFNEEGACAATQTITDESTPLSLSLSSGKYDVYAIGGAQDDRYVWPEKTEATPDSPITLASGWTLDDLQAGLSPAIDLANEEERSLMLSLSRKVLQVKSITIRDVPDNVNAVAVTLAPLYKEMLINGTYGTGEDAYTATLTQQADGTTWQMTTSGTYLYPSVGKPSITVSFTTGGKVKSYTYSSEDELPANHKVSIDGTYTGDGIKISGTISGQDWGEDKTITFSFNETNMTELQENSNEHNIAVLQALSAGDIYLGCYVLAKDDNSVTLISPIDKYSVLTGDETQEEATAIVESALEVWEVDSVSNWKLPDRKQAKMIYDAESDYNSKFSSSMINTTRYNYLFRDTDGNIKRFFESSKKQFNTHTDFIYSYLRPVATITF